MKKNEKTLMSDECPNCGGDLIVNTYCLEEEDDEIEQWFFDGDDVRCEDDCGFISCMCVDDLGAWVQDGNIEELKNNPN